MKRDTRSFFTLSLPEADGSVSSGMKDAPTFTWLVMDLLPHRTAFSLGLKLCCLQWNACLLMIDVSSNVIYWANTVRVFVSTNAHEDSTFVQRAAFFTRSWLSTVHPSSWALTWFYILFFLFAEMEDVFLMKGHASDIVLKSLILWICLQFSFSNKWFVLDL